MSRIYREAPLMGRQEEEPDLFKRAEKTGKTSNLKLVKKEQRKPQVEKESNATDESVAKTEQDSSVSELGNDLEWAVRKKISDRENVYRDAHKGAKKLFSNEETQD